MSQVAASPSPSHFALHACAYGGIAGAATAGSAILLYRMGLRTQYPEVGRWIDLAILLLPIGAMILGMMAWRNRHLAGQIRFVQAFGMALAIGLAFSLLVSAGAWLHAGKLDPDLIANAIDQQAAQAARQPGAQPEVIAEQAAQAKRVNSPVTYAQAMFVRSLTISFFIGLVAAATLPKKRPGL